MSSASGRGKWLVLAAALLGWMFDGAEMGLFSLVGRAAVKDLLERQRAADFAGESPPASDSPAAPANANAPAAPATGPEENAMSLPATGAPLAALTAVPDSEIALWFRVVIALFLIGAAAGGVVFGWLGDKLGRVRAMSLSVLTYAVFTGLCGVVDTPWQIGLLRFVAALGMGGEWALGVALVMEVWPNRSRAFMAGLIGAAANVGYLLVGGMQLGLSAILDNLQELLVDLPFVDEDGAAKLVSNGGWRILMMLGAAPALLTFLIRMFVPESERWQEEKGKGSTAQWATRDLLAVAVGLIGPFATIYFWTVGDTFISPEILQSGGWPEWLANLSPSVHMEHTWLVRSVAAIAGLVVAAVGFTFPVLRYCRRQAARSEFPQPMSRGVIPRMLLAACLSGVALLGTWGSVQHGPSWADKLAGDQLAAAQAELEQPLTPNEIKAAQTVAKAHTQIWLAAGAIVGTLFGAWLGDRIGRRATYCWLCGASLVSCFWFFLFHNRYDDWFLAAAFLAGACTASFYGWLPLYLPELFRTNVRATGQGFGFNFGRILAAVGSLQVTALSVPEYTLQLPNATIDLRGATPISCVTLSLVYLVGFAIIWFAPETRGKPLPD